MTNDWMSSIESVPLNWLLEDNNPPVRYFTMRNLLDYTKNDSELIQAKEQLESYKPIQKIFENQHSAGYWESSDTPYLPKYKASYWQLMLLGMFGLGKDNPRVELAFNHIRMFQHDEGGFSEYMEKGARRDYDYLRNRSLKRRKDYPSFAKWAPEKIREMQLSCLTGNMSLALIRLGYSEHFVVKKALQWLVKIQNEDGGWLCPYWGAHKNDTHGCFMGTITPLDALSEVPETLRNNKMRDAIKQGAEFLLMHHLYKSDHHDFDIIDKRWLKLCFPQFFYDILRGLDVITKLDYAIDHRIDDALRVLLSKQNDSGQWSMECSYAGRIHGTIEHKDKSSKWITLSALRVIKRIVQQRGALFVGEIQL
ncbi:hypothetical protein EU527_18890 [Candidatus Thorarchaeota archaeon]|nr:MAG: hypothetical protein EU527_18890 [Candidatus Thorarchaeota archaeon]